MEYFDDQAVDPGSSVDQPKSTERNVYEPAAIALKNFHLMGVTLYCDEFPATCRTYSRESSKSSCSSPQAGQVRIGYLSFIEC